MKNKNNNSEPIGFRVLRRRQQLKMSQTELAKRTGYGGKTSISKIEKNVNGIPQDKVSLFAEALQTSELYLIGMVDDPNMSVDEIVRADYAMTLSKKDQILVERFHKADDEKKRIIAYLLELDS